MLFVPLNPLGSNKNDYKEYRSFREYLWCRKQRNRKNTPQVRECLSDTFRTKENPGHTCDKECGNDLHRLSERRYEFVFCSNIQVHSVLVQEHERYKIKRIDETPCNERPIGAVPETTHNKNNKNITYFTPCSYSAAT